MLKVHHFLDVDPEPVKYMDGVAVRWVIGEKHGAPFFAMRVFDVEPGRSTEFHAHWWEHEVFVLEGTGLVRTEEEELLRPGSVVFVPGDLKHQFLNTGEGMLRFICCVPLPWLEEVRKQFV